MLRRQLASLILSAQNDKKRNSTISTWREKDDTVLCVFSTGHHILGVSLYVLLKMPTANLSLCHVEK